MSEYGPITDYLPHRPPMVLIDEILDVTMTTGRCRTTIKPDCVFALDGKVHPTAMLEFVAQACAIGVGVMSARLELPPRLGFIIGCREMTFDVDHFNVGDVLEISVVKLLGQDQIGAFSCTVTRDGVVCTTIHLSVVDAELAGAQFAGAGES